MIVMCFQANCCVKINIYILKLLLNYVDNCREQEDFCAQWKIGTDRLVYFFDFRYCSSEVSFLCTVS